MDLKRQQITVKELLANPAAKAVLQKRFPKIMASPMLKAADTLMLYQILDFAKLYVPKAVISATLEELEKA